jgi:hypothetical protein
MSAFTIANGANRPINFQTGTVPDVSGALKDYYQPLIFEQLTKTVSGFQVVETTTPIQFRGLIQPFTSRQLMLRPEGERAWTWFTLFSDPVLTLQVDDVVVWNGKQTRVMSRTDFSLYGYVTYSLVQDWTGAGPST